ncbi:MAG: FAD-dependent oxidoreductase [Desulfurococcaceae archaeon]
MDVDAVVLGCGWAGILTSKALAEQGLRVVCLEKESTVGGLLRSEYVGGFTIDIGGSHVIFSKSKEILGRMLSMLGNNVCSHTRLSYVKLMETLVPYPLENGLYVLPVEERYEALVSFLEALLSLRDGWEPGNLEEWIYGLFGRWIANKYLVPYNKKIWKRPLNEIDVDWVHTPGRLPIPDWRDIVKSALGMPTIGYSEQAKFYYPFKGGIYALFEPVLKEAVDRGVQIITNYPVSSIRKMDRHLVVNNEIRSKRVYSTIPLPDLIKVLEVDVSYGPEQLDFLDYNKIVVVAVAVDKRAPNHHWIYVPDERILFHRYAWLSNYSPCNAPPGKSLVIAEISVPRGVDVPANVVERTIDDLEKLGVFESGEVIFAKKYVHEYGYPIHRINASTKRSEVLVEVNKHGIVSLGRWGSWRYLNMDMVLMDVLNKLNVSV